MYQLSPQKLPFLRPREKLIQYGPDIMRHSELLAIILNTGIFKKNYKEDVLELSARILKDYGSKAIAEEKNVNRLMELLGLPQVKACQIIACFELGRRFFKEDTGRLPNMRTPEDVEKFLAELKKVKKEQMHGLYLNLRNRLIHQEIISIGSLTANIVHPREVFQPAVEYSAAGIILAHNHPSGKPTPSSYDIELTIRLQKVGGLLGIELIDHIIIAEEGICSLKNEKII